MSPGYTAPGPFRERTLRSLSSCLGLLATHSLDPTRTSSNVRFRAAVKDIADIKRALIRATSHFMSTRPRQTDRQWQPQTLFFGNPRRPACALVRTVRRDQAESVG